MGKVKSRVADLVEEKKRAKAADGGKFTLQDMAYETRLAYNTVVKWVKGDVDRFDSDTLATLCEYFDVGVGEILVYDPET